MQKFLIVEACTFSNLHSVFIFSRNCPQFGKDIIKNSRDCFYETPCSIHWHTGSQWSASRTGMMCSYLPSTTTSAVLCICMVCCVGLHMLTRQLRMLDACAAHWMERVFEVRRRNLMSRWLEAAVNQQHQRTVITLAVLLWCRLCLSNRLHLFHIPPRPLSLHRPVPLPTVFVVWTRCTWVILQWSRQHLTAVHAARRLISAYPLEDRHQPVIQQLKTDGDQHMERWIVVLTQTVCINTGCFHTSFFFS